MEIKVEKTIENEVRELNQTARSILDEHEKANGSAVEMRLRHLPNLHHAKYPIVLTVTHPKKGGVEKYNYSSDGKDFNYSDDTEDDHVEKIKEKEEQRQGAENGKGNLDITGEILNHLPIDQKTEILELGPGKGRLLARLAKRAKQVTAIEGGQSAIIALRKKFAKYPTAQLLKKPKPNALKPTILEGEYLDHLTTPEMEGSKDAIVSVFATQLHPHPEALFKAIRNALKPGGTYVITEATPFHEELQEHLEKAGLTVEKVHVNPITRTNLKGYYTTIVAKKR